MARYTGYPTYSGGQWPQQLYPYPQYPQYGWGYPQFPQYGVPAMGGSYAGYPVSPRQRRERRRSLTPAPEIQTHILLGGRYRASTIWDVTTDVSVARHISSGRSTDKISEALLAAPATEPAVHRIRIVSDAFPWDIDVSLARHDVVTVKHILTAIHGMLQQPLEREDWDDETPNVKRTLHKARCARLAKGAASFKLDSHLKRVDILGEKTFFLGLRPVGPPDDPKEWLLQLGPPPKGRR